MIPILLLLLCLLTGCSQKGTVPIAAIDVPLDAVDTSLFLIGDGGRPAPGGEPALIALRDELSRDPRRSFVVFLGDNVYSEGIPDSLNVEAWTEAKRRLGDQIDAVRQSRCRGIFIPGNHDWAHHRDDGWEAIRRQARLIDNGDSLRMLPRDGCPGPVVEDIGSQLRLIVLDTQWWLHKGPKPTDPDSDCPEDSEAEILAALREGIRTAGNRQVVVVGHHPIRSGGEHGGHFTWKDHIFPLRIAVPWLWVPLPIIGSAYPIGRRSGFVRQDLSSNAYEHLRDRLESVFRDNPPLVYAAGHEHNLQVLLGGSARYNLVSGGGFYDHDSHVSRIDGMLYMDSSCGFMRLDVLRDGRVLLNVFRVTAEGRAILRDCRWLDQEPATPR